MQSNIHAQLAAFTLARQSHEALAAFGMKKPRDKAMEVSPHSHMRHASQASSEGLPLQGLAELLRSCCASAAQSRTLHQATMHAWRWRLLPLPLSDR